MCRATLWLLGSLALLLGTPSYSRAQVGLRTAPLTAPRTLEDNSKNNSSGLTLFSSRWMGLGRGNNTNSIESSLAAIFRGVAYGGVSTSQPSSSSTTTTTTTLRPLPPTTATHRSPRPHDLPSRDDDHEYRPARLPVWSSPPELGPEVQQKAVTDQRAPPERPAQTPYVEAPVNTAPDMMDLPPDDVHEVEVVRADGGVGMSQAAWVRALGTAWVVHVYCAAGLYSLLALMALLWVSRVHASTHLLPRGYYITLHLLMFLAAFLRCVHLFHDPYGAQRRLPAALSALVEETCWPCLTAALAVVVLAVVRAWRCPRVLPHKPYAPLALALLTATHLLASVAAYVTSALLPEHAGPLQAAVRAVTAAWGGAVGIGGLLSMWRVGRDWGRFPGRLGRPQDGCSLPPRHPRLALLRGSHLTLTVSFLQILLAALHMYALVGPHYILQLPPSHPWHWLAYQSTCRALEVLMWLLLGIVSALSVTSFQGKRPQHKSGLSVLWCQRCGSCSSLTTSQDKVDEVFPALCQTNHAVRNFTLQTCSGDKPLYQEAVMQEKGRSRRASTVRISHKRPSLRKSATLHSAASDIQLLWNQNQGYSHTAKPSDPSSRPSSMLVNDAGFVRFRMQVENQKGIEKVLQKSLQTVENQNEVPESVQQQVAKDDPPTYNQSFYTNTTPSGGDTSSSPHPKGSPRYEEPYNTNQLEQLLQNRLNCELWGGSGSESGQVPRSELASVTDYSSTDAAPSPPPTAANDWSRYASTCSSISAANSFHVRMFDDMEVASYYHSPSSSSSPHVYATLHRPRYRAHMPRQRAMYIEGEPDVVRGYEARQAVEQLTALLAPRTCSTSPQSDLHVDYLTDGSHEHRMSRGSDSDLCSSASRQQRRCQRHHEEEQPSPGAWRQSRSRRINLHDLTPDSAVVVDYGGHTDEASGEEGELTLPQQRTGVQQSPPRTGLLTKIVKNNFSLGTSGYSPLGTEDNYHNLSLHHQQVLLKQAHQHQQELHQRSLHPEITERVRPCGHRPRRAPRENPTVTSPVRVPVHTHKHQLPPTDHLIRQKKTSARQKLARSLEMEPGRSLDDEDESGVVDGATQTEPRVSWPAMSPSPSSSRPASSLASQSDLHSECVDSEDETHDEASPREDAHSSREATPDLATVDTWPSPTRVPAAV